MKIPQRILSFLFLALLSYFLVSCINAKYTVFFIDWDESSIAEMTIDTYDSESINNLIDKPYRVGYDFNGWEISIDSNTNNITAKATYTIRKFTITWRDYDGSILYIDENIPWGTIPEFKGELPVNDLPDHYDYIGWNYPVYPVYEDFEYIAVIGDRLYDIVFKDWDGRIIEQEKYLYNSEIHIPRDPEREGYYFIGWDTDEFIVTGDKVITAVYNIKEYQITFVDEDNQTIQTELIDSKTPILKETPSLSKIGYDLTWVDEFGDEVVLPYTLTRHIVIKAMWTKKIYIYLNDTGFTKEIPPYRVDVPSMTINTSVGASSTNPSVKTISVSNYGYLPIKFKFLGGYAQYPILLTVHKSYPSSVDDDRVGSGILLSSNATFTFHFNDTQTLYFRFQSTQYFGTVDLEYGDMYYYTEKEIVDVVFEENLTYGATNFTFPLPIEITGYTFNGWYDEKDGQGTKYTDSDGNSIMAWDKTEDTNLYPFYEINKHTVSFINYDGSLINQMTDVPYHSTVDEPIRPTRIGYSFGFWYDQYGSYVNWPMTMRDEDVFIYAHWIPNKTQVTLSETSYYTVQFLNGDRIVDNWTQYVTDSNSLTFPSGTLSGVDKVFAGWYNNPEGRGLPYDFSKPITSDLILYGKLISYTTAFKAKVGGTISSQSHDNSVINKNNYYAFVPLASGEIRIETVNFNGSLSVELMNSDRTKILASYIINSSSNKGLTYNVSAGTLYYVRVLATSSAYNGSTASLKIIGQSKPQDGGLAINRTQIVDFDSAFKLFVPQKDGYIFKGWFDQENGQGTRYTDEKGKSVIKWNIPANEYTLYPYWEVDPNSNSM